MSARHDAVVDPEALRRRVEEATAMENLSRLRALGPLLVAVHLVHVMVFIALRPDTWLDVSSTAQVQTWRWSIAGAHAGAALFASLASLMVWRLGSAASAGARRVPLLVAGSYLVFGALLTGLDQLVTNTINAYLTVSLGVALAVRASTRETVVAYALSFGALLVFCTLLQVDPAQRLSVSVNGLTAMAIGVGLALYANRMTRRRTHQRLVIEAQQRALSAANLRLEAEVTERRRAETELTHLATHDALTGLPNRRAFGQMLSAAIHDAREGKPSTLAVLDLDHFKRVNDAHGHAQGDEVLRDTARAILAALRTDDHAARLGGEEFGVVLRGTAAEDAAPLLDALRVRIAEQRWAQADLRVTTSAGYTTLRGEDHLDAREALQRADAALYAAKEQGRNRVVAA